MRVTKNIREYIEAEVTKRLEANYAADAAEAKHQEALHSAFCEGAAHAAEEAFYRYCEEHFFEVADFCDFNEDNYSAPNFYSSRIATIRDRNNSTSVHNWRRRMRDEVVRISKDIVVTLELGGTRAELEEMLNKI